MGQADDLNTTPQTPAREGLFDAQMSLFLDGPAPLQTVVKRNGTPAAFDKTKIADAIYRAALSIGDDDASRAQNLAAAVMIYLTKTRVQECPSVDEIAAAVERVLLEMGHVRTARAYMRFRERRAKARTFQAGARNASEVLVRTSAETLDPWDRSRIVDALVRETGLDRKEADSIAAEVETIIASARMKEPAAPVIRELVGAKLIERGLIEHGRRHMRLGVPLYDVDRIMREPNTASARDPEGTGRTLAEAVKREYAMTQVFSPEVADAHARGELHLHDLGEIDRLHAATLSPEALTRFGLGAPGSTTFSSPPHYAETLLAQLAKATQLWRRYCHQPVAWDAVNVFFAPFLESMDTTAIAQFARMLVYEFAYRAVEDPHEGPDTEIMLSWHVPARLRRADAIGPDGAPTERLYGDYLHPAQQLAWAVLDVLKDHGARGVHLKAPTPVLVLSPAFFKAEGHERFLRHASEITTTHGNIAFRFERDIPLLDYCEPWEAREIVAHRVTLNLARIACTFKDRHAFSTALRRAVSLAVQAHADKKRFLDELLAMKDAGPLALIAQSNGRANVNMQRAQYWVGLTGFDDCVRTLTGSGIGETSTATALACEVLDELNGHLADMEEDSGIRCVLAETRDSAVTRRLTALDARDYPDEVRRVAFRNQYGEPVYASGLRIAAANMTPYEQAQVASILHEAVAADTCVDFALPVPEAEPDSVASLLTQIYHHTACRKVFFGHPTEP